MARALALLNTRHHDQSDSQRLALYAILRQVREYVVAGARANAGWLGATAAMAVLTVVSLPSPADAEPESPFDDGTLVLVLGGDVGLGGSNQPLRKTGGVRHGRTIPWKALTRGIAPLLDGDLNFANLETVVTDNNKLSAREKAFNFKMHPTGVRQLLKAGFNAFSTANNHAIDYGQAGMRDTIRHLSALRPHGLLAFPGIGRGREALLKPAMIQLGGSKIALHAVGIGGAHVGRGSTRFGQLGYSNTRDFRDGITALAEADAAYRILSVHYGRERQIRPSSGAVKKLRDWAVRDAGIDLVVGHHAHVAAGVQAVGDKLIFYGLGNFLHLGMQNMSKFGACRDFGLLARVFLSRTDKGRYRAQAIQLVPLTEMHESARAMTGKAAHTRIAVLNGLAKGLDDVRAGARGLRFRPQPDGTGLHCAADARDAGGRIGALCRSWAVDGPVKKSAATPVHRCGTTVVATRRNRPALRGTQLLRSRANRKRRQSFASRFFARPFGD